MDTASILRGVAAGIIGLFVTYNLLHYILFLLVTHPKEASKIGHELNEFERRQLAEWTPRSDDCLKHDDESRTYDDVFGVDAWLSRCWRMLKPGGRLMIRSPGSLDHCRPEADYQRQRLLRQLALQFPRR